jgi:inner membrane protein
MDPITHTMLGVTLAQTGLKQRTALATSTLVVGANLPDLDMLAYFWGGETALGFRRGLTHGILALLILPLLLTGLMLFWDRAVRKRRGGKAPAVARQLLLLSYLAVATHPLLDFLNPYGMRLLAPFSYRWFYGDTLFIIDPWVWLLLVAGLWLARQGPGAARAALAISATYVILMAGSNLVARAFVKRSLQAEGIVAEQVMTAPLAVTPFERWVVVADSSGYQVGMLNWFSRPPLQLAPLPYDREPPQEVAELVVRERRAGRFLSWARFPYFVVDAVGSGSRLHIGDARYGVDPLDSWAAISVELQSEP